jgi:hypothetical protein
MNVRIEKLRGDPSRDAKQMAEWQQAAQLPARCRDKSAGRNTDPKMVEFRWMLEELRVAVCTGAAYAYAGVGQALAESVGIDAALMRLQD